MSSFVVAGEEAGRRLDVVLAARLDLSRAAAQKLIEADAVLLGGRPAAKHDRVHFGDEVEYTLPAAPAATLTPEAVPFRLVFEDDWLLVVDKPAGVVVHPAPGHEHGTLVQGLLGLGVGGGHERRPGIVHRLDRDTSGLLIVARTDLAYRRLTAAMARREIARRYVTLVVGDVAADEGVVDAPIGRHVRDRKRMSVHTASPRHAVTHFSVRGRLAGYTLLDVRLETGRTHQIRVHLAAIGHPVAGDVVYGRRPRPDGLERQFLHAARLTFAHPERGGELDFSSPLPADLARFLAVVREV